MCAGNGRSSWCGDGAKRSRRFGSSLVAGFEQPLVDFQQNTCRFGSFLKQITPRCRLFTTEDPLRAVGQPFRHEHSHTDQEHAYETHSTQYSGTSIADWKGLNLKNIHIHLSLLGGLFRTGAAAENYLSGTTPGLRIGNGTGLWQLGVGVIAAIDEKLLLNDNKHQ
jgi:hypothetical protein